MKKKLFMLLRGPFENKGIRNPFSFSPFLLFSLSPFLLFSFSTSVFAQEKKSNKIYYEEEENWKDYSWKRNGFEFYIGCNVYFASKKTASYYNGAPENDINLDMIFKNEYYWSSSDHGNSVTQILHRKYPHASMDEVKFDERVGYNRNSKYNVAVDVALGAKYRFTEYLYIELSYSFRRLTCENRFSFIFPNGIDGNKENPKYTGWQYLLAKEDRHYIDFSLGYIFQQHKIVKPFFSLGAQFTYVKLKSFDVFIEGVRFNLMEIAKNPGYVPGVPSSPGNEYRVWSGAGYGFLGTFGLKIAFSRVVSLDPIFQLSVASFGNSKNMPGFNTKLCFNYIAGVRLVMNDALFTKKR